MNLLLIYPMFAMVLLTWAVASVLLNARIKAARSGKVTMKYYKALQPGPDDEPSHTMINGGRHFVNLFEVPVLFYAACILGVILPMTSQVFLILAWLFVAARVAHAVIHVGSNKVRPRMMSFIVGYSSVNIMWIQILITVISKQ
jgi:hypothetical protein